MQLTPRQNLARQDFAPPLGKGVTPPQKRYELGGGVITAENICKKYRAAKSNEVLRGVSLRAGPGEIIGIVGANGSGKSTLLSILVTIQKPDSGKISLSGKPIDPKLLGYCPQETALHENLSVRDNIRFWAAAYNAQPSSAQNWPDEKFLARRVKKLSVGTKKWLSVNLADLHNPQILIMDEPSAGLDIDYKNRLREKFMQTKSENRTVIFSTHHQDEMLWCDRLYVLREGLFVYEGAPQGFEW